MNFLIPICYVLVGILLLTDLFEAIGEEKRILFGVIVIGYGIFRLYKAWGKMRN